MHILWILLKIAAVLLGIMGGLVILFAIVLSNDEANGDNPFQ